jgi:hypothetical protein
MQFSKYAKLIKNKLLNSIGAVKNGAKIAYLL